MNRQDLQRLSQIRVTEAAALLASGYSDGAYYLAGYAVECALKAVIARQTQMHEFPDKQRATDSFVHDLERLAKVAGLKTIVESAAVKSPHFRRNWDTVTEWSETSRYKVWSWTDANEMINAVTDVNEGVLPWITQHW